MLGYNKIDQQIHQLIQTIAKFNRTYADKRTDDSHTSLAFDSVGMRMLGRWVQGAESKLIMSLNLVDFKFEIFNSAWELLSDINIENRTQTQIEKMIQEYLPEAGLDIKHFKDPLHFEITKYQFAFESFNRWGQFELITLVRKKNYGQ